MSQDDSVCGSADYGDLIEATWARFLQKIAPGSDGMEELYVLLNGGNTSNCHHCAGSDVTKEEGARTFTCLDCGAVSWFTSGTFFEGVKKPIVWMGAIYLIEEGINISAHRLSRLAKVAYHTAWTVMKKLELVVDSHRDSEIMPLPDYLFKKIFYKRSKESFPNQHPSLDRALTHSEQTRDKSEANGHQSEAVLDKLLTGKGTVNDSLSSQEQMILNFIEKNPKSFDAICDHMEIDDEFSISAISAILGTLELSGLVERLPGDQYSCIKVKRTNLALRVLNKAEKMLMQTAIDALKSTLSGISRKYLQLYLAKFWCFSDRKRWGAQKLFQACAAYDNIPYSTILNYSTAAVVNLCAQS